MRENRTYGSEGGEAETNRPSLPLSFGLPLWALPGYAAPAIQQALEAIHRLCDEQP